MRSRLLLALLLALLAVPSPAVAATSYVNVDLLRWDPAELTVRPNDQVIWSFGNALDEHTLNSKDTATKWEQPLAELKNCGTGLQDVARSFPKPGQFMYQCDIHENMKGTITVRSGAALANSGVSSEGRNAQECPPPGLPLSVPAVAAPTPPPPAAPGVPAPLVNTTPAPTAPVRPTPEVGRERVAAPAAIRRVGVRALSTGVRVRFSLARRGTVSVRILSLRTRKVVKRATLRRMKAGANSVRVPVRRLARGRYTVEVAAGRTVVRKRVTVR